MTTTPAARLARALRSGLAALASGSGLAARSLRTPLRRRTRAERLAALRTDGLPLEAPVAVRWNDHLVPWIEAGGDGDLAFAFGYVQAHLRAGHVAVTKRIARGRLAESFGPAAVGLDKAIRVLGLDAAAAANAALLPEPTRLWVERYCDGLNHYFETARPLPHDVAVLALGGERFTVEDVLAMGRLCGNDITWVGWASLLRHRDRPDWPAIWAEALRHGGGVAPATPAAPGAPAGGRALEALLEGAGRHGSNAVAIAGSRVEGGRGGALLAGDPHVGIFLPNIWMVLGLRSPTQAAVGLTLPGVPFLPIGRNADIAWGATNMRAASSDLVDVGGLPPSAFAERVERVAVRWGRPTEVRVRTTAYGPVVSDVAAFPGGAGGRPMALRWTGHGPSDEITAMLDVARARDFEGFRQAFAPWGISGQNYLYADRTGRIGRVLAVHLPARAPEPPADPVLRPEASRGWERPLVTALGLPHELDPPEGAIVSANDPPAGAAVLVGYLFAAPDRARRLRALIASRPSWDLGALAALQRDVVRPSALALRDAALRAADAAVPAAGAVSAARRLLEGLRGWDGAYEADRPEPARFELFAAALADGFQPGLGPLEGSEAVLDLLAERLGALPPDDAAARVLGAAARAAPGAARVGSWGELHRLKLHHVLANLPGVGRRYPRADPPVGGSTTTLMKTAHGPVRGPHGVRFGANARHAFDLSDPDANWFALLGGNDGDVESPCALDQLPMWLEGRYMRVPLRPEAVAAEFSHVTRLEPARGANGAAPSAAPPAG